MTPEEIREIIKGTQSEDGGKGRMFEVTFRKRTTGEVRVLRGRLGMSYGFEKNDDGSKTRVTVTGKGMAYNPTKHNLMTVREASGGFRNIPLDAVISLRVPDSSKHLVGVAV